MNNKLPEIKFFAQKMQPRLHKSEPYSVRFGISSKLMWASLLDNMHIANMLVNTIKTTRCANSCPFTAECSGPQVKRRSHYHLEITVEAKAKHAIYHPSSGARCMRKK